MAIAAVSGASEQVAGKHRRPPAAAACWLPLRTVSCSRIHAPMCLKRLTTPPAFTADRPEDSPAHPVSTHLAWLKCLMLLRNPTAKGIEGLKESEIPKAGFDQWSPPRQVHVQKNTAVLCDAAQA